MAPLILVVDDEPILSLEAVSFLQKHGYAAEEVGSGEACLDRLERDSLPDLLLMDIDLGRDRMDGTDTARRIYRSYDIPIVFRSSHSDQDTIEKTEEITPYGYVYKGAGNEKLLLMTLKMAFKLHTARKELKQKEETYRLAMHASNEGLWDWHVESGVVYYSPAWEKILGETKLEERYATWERRIHSEDYQRVITSLNAHLRGETEQWNCDHRLRARDGRWVWVAGHGQVVSRDEAGKPLRMVGTMTDISDYKSYDHIPAPIWVEECSALRKELSRLQSSDEVGDLRTFLEGHPDEVERLTGLLRIEEVNEAALRLLEDESSTRVRGPLHRFTTPETLELLKEEFLALAKGRSSFSGETRGLTASGRVIDILVMARLPLPDEAKQKMVVTTIEISERVRLQQELREAYAALEKELQEKEFLMREAYHRIKNNLAMISSLINLHTENAEENSTLIDIKQQMRAVSMLHEKLYRSDTMSSVELGQYLVELTESFFSFFTVTRVTVDADCEQITVYPDIAVYLGLLTNEVATNAAKYGFTDGTEDHRFFIRLIRTAEGIELTLKNSGRPFPPHISFPDSSTLGLRLIEALGKQLDAEIELQRTPSPAFIIRMPLVT